MPRTNDRMEFAGLPWVRFIDPGRGPVKDREVWYVEIEGTNVWVKNYGNEHPDSPFSGWRVGRGGSPGQVKYANRDEAMTNAKDTVLKQTDDKVEELRASLKKAEASRERALEAFNDD